MKLNSSSNSKKSTMLSSSTKKTKTGNTNKSGILTTTTTTMSSPSSLTKSSSNDASTSNNSKTKKMVVAAAPKQLKSLFRSTTPSFSKSSRTKKASTTTKHDESQQTMNDDPRTILQASTFETHLSHDENHPPVLLCYNNNNNSSSTVQPLHGHDRLLSFKGDLICPSSTICQTTTSRRGILGSTSSGNSVHFGRTEILEFPQRAGDNPSVKFGAPLALDTQLLSRRTLSVDDYEEEHPTNIRRHKQELVLEATQRMKRIRESGVSTAKDIRKAVQVAAETRESRDKQAKLFQKEWGDRHILSYRISA